MAKRLATPLRACSRGRVTPIPTVPPSPNQKTFPQKRFCAELREDRVSIPSSAPPTTAGFFAEHDVASLAAQLRTGELTPRGLVEHALGAAWRWEHLNAFAYLDAEGARAAADQAAAELAAGRDRGPLHGIPVAVKDVIDVAGMPTTSGSRHLLGLPPVGRDAECVRLLREAGMVIVGKTTTHELAYGPTGDCSVHGATRNPHSPRHMAGGSSCGSGAAVGAGVVPLALGTDTGGSVRIPAACCGIVGLRPTYQTVPTTGVHPLAASLDTVGVLARSAADCRLLWRAIAQAPPAAPVSGAPRLKWLSPDDLHPTAPAVATAAREAASALLTDTVHLPVARDLSDAYHEIQGAEAYTVHGERLRTDPDSFSPEVRGRLEAASTVPAWRYAAATTLRESAARAVASVLEDGSLLALPTLPVPVPVLDTRIAVVGDHPALFLPTALLALTSPWSVIGYPALSIPAPAVGGLPTGLQLVGPPGSEHRLLAAAEHLITSTQLP